MEQHPPPVRPTRDLAQLQHDFEVYGFAMIAEALTPEQVRRARERVLDQAQAEVEQGLGLLRADPEHPNQQVRNLLGKGDVFQELVLNPIMNEFVESRLGYGYQLSSCVANIMHPGGPPQSFHWDQVPNDSAMGMATGPTNPFLCAFSAGYALDDFTAENGGTRLVPGSHKWKERPNAEELAQLARGEGKFCYIQAECPAGTIVTWDGRLLHAGSDNQSAHTRVLANCLWTRACFRTQENHMLCVPQRVLDSGGPKLQRLLGYEIYASLGMADGVDSSGDLTTPLRRSQDWTPELSPAAPKGEYFFENGGSFGRVLGTPVKELKAQHTGHKLIPDAEGKRRWIDGGGAGSRLTLSAPTRPKL